VNNHRRFSMHPVSGKVSIHILFRSATTFILTARRMATAIWLYRGQIHEWSMPFSSCAYTVTIL